jgi:hypothetical protein
MHVSCSVCGGHRDKDDPKEVPILYNVGEGPRYVGECCYEFFSFQAVMWAYEATKRALRRDRPLSVTHRGKYGKRER